jgi:DNA-binding winged helix-turn-helix (wHTH) protein
LRLTRLERRLLACLIEPPLRVWPYDLLYRTVWRQAWLGDTSTVHAIVKRLRRRLRDAGVTVVVESIRGVGFSLVFQPAEIASASRAELAITPGAPRQLASSSESAIRAAATPSWKRVTTP